jgi:hypothetical protein
MHCGVEVTESSTNKQHHSLFGKFEEHRYSPKKCRELKSPVFGNEKQRSRHEIENKAPHSRENLGTDVFSENLKNTDIHPKA